MEKILILTDFSAAARSAADLGLSLAGQAGVDILLLNAWQPPLLVEAGNADDFPMEQELAEARDAHFQLHQEATRLYLEQKRSQPPRPAVIETVSYRATLAEALHATLPDIECLFALSGIFATESASLLNDIFAQIHCPLLIVPELDSSFQGFKNIAFATDLQEGAGLILPGLKRFSDRLGSKLSIMHVSKPAFNMAAEEEMRIAAFMTAMAHAGLPSSAYEQTYSELTSAAIESFAIKKHAGILAMVLRQHSLFWKLFHKSHVDDMLAHHLMPLLLLPESGH